MNYTIKDVSEGGDFEVYADNRLVATCGTNEVAKNLIETLEAAGRMHKALLGIIEDCRMALSGEWDKSDDGFQATKDNAEDAVTAFINTGIFRSPGGDKKGKMVILKCASFGSNSNGEPDIFFCRFLLSEEDASEDREEGYLPRDLVRDLAEKEGYESNLVCDELDPAGNVMQLCEWHTIPIYDRDLNMVKPEPLPGSIWFRARENSFWMVSGEPSPKVTLFELRNPEDGSDPDPAVITGRAISDVAWDQIQPELGHMMFLPYVE